APTPCAPPTSSRCSPWSARPGGCTPTTRTRTPPRRAGARPRQCSPRSSGRRRASWPSWPTTSRPASHGSRGARPPTGPPGRAPPTSSRCSRPTRTPTDGAPCRPTCRRVRTLPPSSYRARCEVDGKVRTRRGGACTGRGLRRARRPVRAGTACSGLVVGVDVLGVAAEHVADLLHEHVAHEGGHVVGALGAREHRPPVHDDAVREARGEVGGEVAPQRHRAVLPRRGRRRRHLLDGELDAVQLATKAPLQPFHGGEHDVVELLAAGACTGQQRRQQRSPQPPAVPVPAPPGPPRGQRDARDVRAVLLHHTVTVPPRRARRTSVTGVG